MKRLIAFAVATVAAVSLVMTVLLMGIGCTTENDSGSYYDDNNNNNNNNNTTQDQSTYLFTRHAFMEENAAISSNASTAEKAAWASKHFDDALAYMKEKVAAYENRLDAEGLSDNFVKKLYEKSLELTVGKYGDLLDQTHVDDFLCPNNLVFPWVLGGIGAELVAADDVPTMETHRNMVAHFNALALRAYNDSLGTLRNSQTLPFNQEYDQINMTLQGYNHGAYAANDYRQIEDALYDMLRTVSNQSGISVQTLVDTVDLCLLETSLWGARDLGAQSGVQLCTYKQEVAVPDYNHVPYLNTDQYAIEISSGYGAHINECMAKREQQNGLTR